MTSSGFLGEKLRLARLFHGMSQPELGELVATSRQFIHQLEAESKAPSLELLNALADVLNVSASFFQIPIGSIVNVDQCHFRRLRTTPLHLTRQVIAHGTLLNEVVNLVDRIVEMPVPDFPDYDGTTAVDIERSAERCRMHWGLGLSGPIVNMTRVLENAGAVVTHFPGVSEKIDAFSISRSRPIVVRSQIKTSACRLRYDLAHECGHLVLHKGLETGDRASENQANRFASAFLMPRTVFSKEFPRSKRLDWRRIFKLKLRWKVSAAALVRRAYDLELIDHVQYRRANVHLSKTGQKKSEKFDDWITPETPELMRSCFEIMKMDFGPFLKIFEDQLGISRDILSRLTNLDFDDGDPGDTNFPPNVLRFRLGTSQ